MQPTFDNEPIFALATGKTDSAIAVIRLTGENLLPLVSRIFQKKHTQWRARQLYLGKIIDERVVIDECQQRQQCQQRHRQHKIIDERVVIDKRQQRNCQHKIIDERVVIDECLAVYFPAPNSYSGQDMVEIHCHGGAFIKQKIFALLQKHHVRPALAGEFTKRAFLSGKLDLATAEGISQLINAQTEAQWQVAKTLAFGEFQRKINELRSKLIEAMSLLNALIDFPDERETQTTNTDTIANTFKEADEQINVLLASYQQGQVAMSGLRIALVGKPNVGKSSLLNILLKKERAIVSSAAGTTRDYLEESFLLAGRLFKLVDTAGLRTTSDTLEYHGIKKTNEIISTCDLVCHLISAVDPSPPLQLKAASDKVLKVINKVDLLPAPLTSTDIAISCKTGTGIEELCECLLNSHDALTHDIKHQPYITCERHYLALQQASTCLQKAIAGLQTGLYTECIAFEGQSTVQILEEIIGKVSNDDILEKIFSQFCLGK